MSNDLKKYEVWEYDKSVGNWLDDEGVIIESNLTWNEAVKLVRSAPDHLFRVIDEIT